MPWEEAAGFEFIVGFSIANDDLKENVLLGYICVRYYKAYLIL